MSKATPTERRDLATLSTDEARALTEEVKAGAAELWAKLLALHEGQAHTALGYSSWGSYYAKEFGQRARTGYRLLEAARVDEALSDMHVTPSQNVARELAPVLKDEGSDALKDRWSKVIDLHGPRPTAGQVRTLVREARLEPTEYQLKAQAWDEAKPSPLTPALATVALEDAAQWVGGDRSWQDVEECWFEGDEEREARYSINQRKAIARQAGRLVTGARRIDRGVAELEGVGWEVDKVKELHVLFPIRALVGADKIDEWLDTTRKGIAAGEELVEILERIKASLP